MDLRSINDAYLDLLRSINDAYLDLLESVKIDRLVKVNWFIVAIG